LRQHSDDDFGDLGQAIDRMAEALTEKEKRLQKSLKELEVTNKDLEAAVQERTSQLRAAQDELIKQERLSALGQMASGIAHDISNALSPVVGYADLLHSTTDNLTEEQQSFVEMIRTSAIDVSQLLTRMRKFYRPRDESQPLMPVQLNHLIKQVVDLTRPRWKDMAQERGVTITVDMELQEDAPTVLGIESELREALSNLVINAVDAMPRGGTITIRTRSFPWIVGMAATAEPFVILEVSDTGIGMDDETKRRCLEPFFTTKGEFGTGLGLSMAYGVMRRHQGSIEIESQCNQGTTVRLILPSGWIAETQTQEEVRFSRHASNLRILVVDDEARLRKLIKVMLEKDGHIVTLADGGESGLEAFRAARTCDEPFDVVITDLGMPYVDGRLVARTVKHEAPRTPVILLTGWGTRTQADGEVLKDVDAVLSKPPRLDELLSTVAWASRHLVTNRSNELTNSHSYRA
jgi:signal transduction histidine kinase/FixJ family two-component response regulator